MIIVSVNRIWIALLLATGATYWLGEQGGAGPLGMVSALLLMALSLVKGLWVIYDFMELRHAPRLWRLLLVGWLGLVTSMTALAYWIGVY